MTWTGSILLFVNVQGISFSSKLQRKVCVKGKRINRKVGYGLETPAEYKFCGIEKTIKWSKRTLNGVNGNVKKKF